MIVRDLAQHIAIKSKNSRCRDQNDRCHFPYRNRPRKDFAKDAKDGELSRTGRNKTSDRVIEDDVAVTLKKNRGQRNESGP